jgi:hypothetical protein
LALLLYEKNEVEVMIYEIREYHAVEGKKTQLDDRFKNHTLDLFLRHNINVVGFWQKKEDPSILVYLCKFEDENQQKTAWKAFGADPDWQRIKTESEAEGPLTTQMNSTLLEPVPYF